MIRLMTYPFQYFSRSQINESPCFDEILTVDVIVDVVVGET
jgi:hypothetical protein